MKNLIPKSACALLGLALLVGCQSSGDNNNAGKASVDTTSKINTPTRVAILFSQPKQAYDEVGSVSAYKVQPDASQTWQNTFQKQAAARGADAVIVNTSTLNNINTPLVTGTAIRFKTATPPAQ